MSPASEGELFDQLCFYTLSNGDPEFLHQHAVDAFAVQTANDETKLIAVVFGLAGLYLHLERGFTGREVQRRHMAMARTRTEWPHWPLPPDRGSFRVADVLRANAGPATDAAIELWCSSVWAACSSLRGTLVDLLDRIGVYPAE